MAGIRLNAHFHIPLEPVRAQQARKRTFQVSHPELAQVLPSQLRSIQLYQVQCQRLSGQPSHQASSNN